MIEVKWNWYTNRHFDKNIGGLLFLHHSIHILIDSTGLKIYGAGEWEEPKHGKGRRKGWMKLHLAIDENSKEIEASTLTDHLTFRRISSKALTR